MSIDVAFRQAFGAFDLDIAFSAASTGITVLFGPSGSGKSTCINVIAGLQRPEAGHIAVAGEVLFDSAGGIDVPARKRRAGYVFQDARLFPHLSVAGNLEFGTKRSVEPPSPQQRDRIIGMLGLGHLLERRPHSLSGGERQRVAIGRALLSGPRMLLLDEPLAALDQGRKSEILPFLERLRDEERLPVIYVSHAIDEVARLADTIVLVNEGRVEASGPVDDILTRLDLFPLTGRFEAGAVIRGRIETYDPASMMSSVAFAGGRFWIPGDAGEPGQPVRLRVRARDVMLATEAPQMISANNVLGVTIIAMREEKGPFLDVQLACGEARLLARITRMSRDRLGIEPGARVQAIVKSVSVESAIRRRDDDTR
jgi:molybdate transport system ATP-binding protein